VLWKVKNRNPPHSEELLRLCDGQSGTRRIDKAEGEKCRQRKIVKENYPGKRPTGLYKRGGERKNLISSRSSGKRKENPSGEGRRPLAGLSKKTLSKGPRKKEGKR